MAIETFFQADILTNFIYPFLLLFFILFAIMEKWKVLGDNKQTNALISFVISLIFVSAVLPKFIVGNLILIMSVLIVLAFVIFLIWGFIGGKVQLGNKSGTTVIVIIVIILIVAVLSMAEVLGPIGNFFKDFFNLIFYSSWSKSFWENALFVIIIAAALAVVLRKTKTA